MSIEIVNIIGAGGHARVVADAMLSIGRTNLRVFDADPALYDSPFLGVYNVSMFARDDMTGKNCHVAIGSNQVREKLSFELSAVDVLLVIVEHPDSSVSRFAEIGSGCFIAARAIVGPGAKLGAGTIINHAAVIDHDCTIGVYCHVAPGAILGGGVKVGNKCLIGASATVLPGIMIGADVTIGAGSVVTKDVPPNSIWVGLPAKAMEFKQNG